MFIYLFTYVCITPFCASTRYLACAVRHMDALQPFQDVPAKLTTQLKRSLVALRSFVQGLYTARDVLRHWLKVRRIVR